MRKLSSLISIFVSALLSGCGNTGQINDALSGTPKSLRDCNEIAIKVLLASYEKAGENQGRLVRFTTPTKFIRDDGMFKRWDATSISVNLDGKIVNTPKGEIPYPEYLGENSTDFRIKSKTADSLSCGIYFEGEGNSPWGNYTITKDKNSLYWRQY